MELWQPHGLLSREYYYAEVGPLQLWLRLADDELRVAVRRLQESDDLQAAPPAPVEGSPPEDLDWSRWVVGDSAATMQLSPAMPDRPVVVRPEMPVNLPPACEALFFVSVPIWVRISAGSGDLLKLCEHASVVLSNTWFGDPMSGELCYTLWSRAMRVITDAEPRPHRAVCPLRIRNKSQNQLPVERFCVHAEHLRIYSSERQLWTNEVNVTFAGDAEVNQVSYSQHPPDYESTGKMLAEARLPVKKGLLQRSLSSFVMSGGA